MAYTKAKALDKRAEKQSKIDKAKNTQTVPAYFSVERQAIKRAALAGSLFWRY